MSPAQRRQTRAAIVGLLLVAFAACGGSHPVVAPAPAAAPVSLDTKISLDPASRTAARAPRSGRGAAARVNRPAHVRIGSGPGPGGALPRHGARDPPARGADHRPDGAPRGHVVRRGGARRSGRARPRDGGLCTGPHRRRGGQRGRRAHRCAQNPSPLVRGRAAEALGLVGTPAASSAPAIAAASAGCPALLAPIESRRRGDQVARDRGVPVGAVRPRPAQGVEPLAGLVLDAQGAPVSRWWPVAFALQRVGDKRAGDACSRSRAVLASTRPRLRSADLRRWPIRASWRWR